MLIDTHAHLFWDSFKEDFYDVLNRAKDAGVQIAINVGVDVHTSAIATRMQSDQIKFYSSMGIHPEDVTRYDTDNPEEAIRKDIAALEKLYEEYPDKIKAIGECGLDYTYYKEDHIEELNKSSTTGTLSKERYKDLQRMLLTAQLELAKKLNLPLLLHVRDDRSKDPENSECWDEVLEIVGEHFGILHCYSGLPKTTQKALGSNFLFSFAGNITYKNNEYLREAIKIIPLDKIVLETDCPFLPPQSIRGKRNEPSSVKEIAQLIAELKDISLEEVEKYTTQNVKILLKI